MANSTIDLAVLRLRRWEARVVSVPLAGTINTPIYSFPGIESVFVRVTDADGAVGYSYLWCFGERQAELIVAALEYLTEHATANDDTLPGLLSRARREINFLGYKGVTVFALSAIDMAIHDLICRRLGASLSSLVGRRRNRVPVYWSGLFLDQSIDGLVRETERAHAAGFRAFKLRVGKAALREDVARLEAVARSAGVGTVVMLDAVQSWDATAAIEASAAFAPVKPLWLEDPLPHHDYEGLRRVCEESSVAIATGENEYLREGFAELLRCGPAYLLADFQRVGGISEWNAVAGLSADAATILTPHVYPHLAVQLAAALEQDEVWIEYLPWWDDLMTYNLDVRDGTIEVPDIVGTGVDPDPEKLEKYAVTPWLEVAVGDGSRRIARGVRSATLR